MVLIAKLLEIKRVFKKSNFKELLEDNEDKQKDYLSKSKNSHRDLVYLETH